MDFFKKLTKDLKKIPWGAFASVVTEEFQSRTGATADMVDQLKNWATLFTAHAVQTWTPRMAAQDPCESPDVSTGKERKCTEHALALCDVCGRKCCLFHARLDYMGGAICEVCIGAAKARHRGQGGNTEKPAGPSREEIARALKDLGLKRSATWEEVRKQYKKLIVEYNADRPQSERSRAHNTERMKRINAAFAVLSQVHEGAKEKAA